jgi:hypothetical protein
MSSFMVCTSYQILKKIKVGGACSKYGGKESCMQDFAGKPEGKRPLGIPRHRWEVIIKKYLLEVGWGGGHGLDWSGPG